MDRRILIGIIVVLVIGVGVIGYSFMPKTEPGPEEPGPEEPGPEEPGPEEPGPEEPGQPTQETATVSGTVTDDSGTPLADAFVKVGESTGNTTSEGTFELPVSIGSYIIEVTKEDYSKGVMSLSVTENITYTVGFTLKYISSGDVKGKVLKVITRHGADILFAAESSFLESEAAKAHEIVDIEWKPIGPTLWVDTIKRTDDLDVAWGGGPVLFDVVNREGLLSPLTSEGILETLNDIPYELGGVPTRRVSDGDIYWTGSAVASFGFTININYLEMMGLPEPTKWSDLANETYAVTLPSPSVGTADATKSTSNTRMFTIILQAYGWQDGWNLLIRMGANSRIYDQSGLVRDAVIREDIGVGTTIDFYGYTAQLKNPEFCKYIFPTDGTIVNADPIALLTTSKNPEAAQAFIEWILTPEGQKIWLDEDINRLPMNPAVFDTPEGQAREDLKQVYEETKEALTIDFSDELALSYESAMQNFYHAVIVRSQLKLEKLWEDITWALEEGDITREEFNDLIGKMGDPYLFEFTDPETGDEATFTQEYAQSICDVIGVDAEFKTRMVDAWIVAAEAHYDSIREEFNQFIG